MIHILQPTRSSSRRGAAGLRLCSPWLRSHQSPRCPAGLPLDLRSRSVTEPESHLSGNWEAFRCRPPLRALFWEISFAGSGSGDSCPPPLGAWPPVASGYPWEMSAPGQTSFVRLVNCLDRPRPVRNFQHYHPAPRKKRRTQACRAMTRTRQRRPSTGQLTLSRVP